jgi:hypothetical protein
MDKKGKVRCLVTVMVVFAMQNEKKKYMSRTDGKEEDTVCDTAMRI